MRTMAFSNGIACAHVNCVEHPDVCLDYSIRTNYPIFMGYTKHYAVAVAVAWQSLTLALQQLRPVLDSVAILSETRPRCAAHQHDADGALAPAHLGRNRGAHQGHVRPGLQWHLGLDAVRSGVPRRLCDSISHSLRSHRHRYLEHSLSTQENDGILRLLADHYNGKIHFGKIDCWEHSGTAIVGRMHACVSRHSVLMLGYWCCAEVCQQYEMSTFPRTVVYVLEHLPLPLPLPPLVVTSSPLPLARVGSMRAASSTCRARTPRRASRTLSSRP